MTARRFIEICEQERAAILRGDLAVISAFAEEKRLAFAALRDRSDAKDLAAALAASEQSDRLLTAVLSGLRRARMRLKQIHEARETRTYDASGARTVLACGTGRLARKA